MKKISSHRDKTKNKYRELNTEYQNHKGEYEQVQEVIELQFENIEKRFMDFEVVMENNEYHEVVHIVKALDTMIDHMAIVIDEVPDLLLLADQIIRSGWNKSNRHIRK